MSEHDEDFRDELPSAPCEFCGEKMRAEDNYVPYGSTFVNEGPHYECENPDCPAEIRECEECGERLDWIQALKIFEPCLACLSEKLEELAA